MFAGRGTRLMVRLLDFLGGQFSADQESPEHLRIGVRGEERMKLTSNYDEWVT
jgi:hypothetical protein